MPHDIRSKNPAALSVIDGTAPHFARMSAARGILPLPQSDLIEVLVALAEGTDQELASVARETLAAQSPADLERLVESGEAAPSVLGWLLRRPSLPAALCERVVTHADTPDDAMIEFARSTSHTAPLELLSLNQQLLIRSPELIDAILSNPNRSAEAERRVVETRREFFEKERGAAQAASELRAQGNHAAAEFIEQADFSEGGLTVEDAIFLSQHIEVEDRDTDDSWMGLEYLEEIYEETDAQRRAAFEKILGEMSSEEGTATAARVSMLNRVMKMGMKDRIKLGMKGDREARNILIRDPNRMVASAVINNPRITEQEVESVAAMRTVPEDVLRQIAMNRSWMRNYTIVQNLVKNPRTPIGNSMSLMNRMQFKDLVALTKNKNVPEAVRRHALRLSKARSGDKS
ncbi:MAG: hypothetical protein ACK4S4_07240 [Pyrinomonadaceae bacterium]